MSIYNNGAATLTAGDIERMQQRIAELEREKAELLVQVADAFGDGYYDGFLDGAKHHEKTDCNTDKNYLGDHAMYCSEIAENKKSKRLGIVSRQELAAQVEYVKSHFNELIQVAQRCDSWESFPQEPLDRAAEALESLPAQCLNQIKAEVIAKSADWLHSNYPHLANPACGLLMHHAERVKAGEV